MITDDDHVAEGLGYLRDGDKSEELHFRAMVAEQEAKRVFAQQTLIAQGPVELRKAIATVSAEYQEAIHQFNLAKAQLKRHEEMREAAVETNKVWQSENANARAAERVR